MRIENKQQIILVMMFKQYICTISECVIMFLKSYSMLSRLKESKQSDGTRMFAGLSKIDTNKMRGKQKR